jgi:single-strand DNA-binding protein
MNSVNLIGNLTLDPRAFTYGENTGIDFTIAYNHPKITTKNGEVKEKVSFFECVAYRNADTLLRYLEKGKKVGITGSLELQKWEQNGETRSKVVVIVDRLDFLTPKTGGKTQTAGEKDEAPETVAGDTLSDWV